MFAVTTGFPDNKAAETKPFWPAPGNKELTPADQLLLISAGVGATPTGQKKGPLGMISLPAAFGPPRADALLFIESKGKASQALLDGNRAADLSTPNYRGRY